MTASSLPDRWMLKEAYSGAQMGNLSSLHRQQALFQTPYDEHLGDLTHQYFRHGGHNSNIGGLGYVVCLETLDA